MIFNIGKTISHATEMIFDTTDLISDTRVMIFDTTEIISASTDLPKKPTIWKIYAPEKN